MLTSFVKIICTILKEIKGTFYKRTYSLGPQKHLWANLLPFKQRQLELDYFGIELPERNFCIKFEQKV